MTQHPTTSSFSVNSLLAISEENAIPGQQPHFSWPPSGVATTETNQKVCIKPSSAIFVPRSNMNNHENGKTLTKLDSNSDETASFYPTNPHYSKTPTLSGEDKTRGNWSQNQKTLADSKTLEKPASVFSVAQERVNWNPAFHSCAYKKHDYPVGVNSTDNDCKTMCNQNETQSQNYGNENTTVRSKTWGSSEGSETGNKQLMSMFHNF